MNSISVIITCYNEGELLRDAVASVRSQTLQPRELIIVNDGSTDAKTISICKELESSGDATVLLLDSNGVAISARNRGFSAAQGEILVPLDGDDILPPNALERISHILTESPNYDFVASSFIVKRTASQTSLVRGRPITLASLLRAKRFSLGTNWTLVCTAPLRKSVWQSCGGCDENLTSQELWDVDFWIRAMRQGARPYPTTEVLYIWRRYLGNESKQISASSWSKLAHAHFETFRSCGLTHRAYELLLMGSMWAGEQTDIHRYRRALLTRILRGSFGLSSIVILLLPAWLFRALVRYVKPYG